jgi:hypothetical protein
VLVRRLGVTIVVWLAVVAGTASGAGSSGIGGVLYRGPVTPVCRTGIPCDAPAPGVTLVFTRAGRDARTRTRTGGRFSIPLVPGVYAVRIVPAPVIGSGLRPRVVRVPEGGWARVRLSVDTGIR